MVDLFLPVIVLAVLVVFFVLALSSYFRWKHESWNTTPEEFVTNYKNVQDRHGQDLDE